MRAIRLMVLVAGVLALAVSARAQAPVTVADLTRLDATADEIGKQVVTLKRTDVTLAAQVERSLADLRDEIAYLKVKLRKDGSVARAEYSDLRDRLETLRLRALGEKGGAKVSAQPVFDEPLDRVYTVPVGTRMDVRLQTALNSGTAKVEQRFEATTIEDFTMNGRVVIAAGTTVRGFVSSVSAAGRVSRKGSLTLSFDEVRLKDRSVRLRASVEQTLDGKVGQDATRIGAGAVVGGIIGGILGGGKGALVGVLVGGGGTIAATDGSDVNLPVGTILRIRIDQAVEISGVK